MTDRPGIRLWTRLSGDAGEHQDVVGSDYEYAVVDSVRDHLTWLLNSRQGDAPACADYGLPDITAVIAGLPKSERHFCAALEKTIREHEPRISWVRVCLGDLGSPGGAKVYFTIEFRLKPGDLEKQRLSGNVNFDTVFTLS
jgi:type VI secretion system lysozyme-like protein